MGISYLRLGDAEAAIEHLDKYSSDDDILAPISKGAIGDAFSELGQDEEANTTSSSRTKNKQFYNSSLFNESG